MRLGSFVANGSGSLRSIDRRWYLQLMPQDDGIPVIERQR